MVNKALPVTGETFEPEVLKAEGSVLVDFWAPWCGPCQQLAPVLDEMARTHENLKVVKVNVDEHPEIAARYQITSIPAMKLIRDGEVLRELTGAMPRHVLEKKLEGLI